MNNGYPDLVVSFGHSGPHGGALADRLVAVPARTIIFEMLFVINDLRALMGGGVGAPTTACDLRCWERQRHPTTAKSGYPE
uniref:Uncharacterized protein n=1 Tax=mine drainage metagenome TaxID=410659 RepID=E6PSH8_9ZZZZ